MQSFLCKQINKLYFCTMKYSSKKREKILFLSFFFIFLFGFYYSVIPSNVHLFYKCLWGSIFLFVSIIFSIDKPLQPKKLDNIWLFLIIFFGLSRIISSLLVSLEFLPLALIWCFEFIVFFYINAIQDNFSKIIYMIAKAFNVVLTLYFIISILFIRFTYGQYTGIMINPNSVGQIVVIGFPLILLLLYKEEKKKKRKIYYLNLILCLYFCYLSSSRTGIITFLFVILMKFGLDIVVRKRNVSIYFKNILTILIASFVLIICINPINNFTTQLVSKISNNFIQQEVQENTIIKSNKQDISKDNTLTNRVLGKDKTGNSLEDYSSGRTGIWKEVLNSTNLFGHPSREHLITERNGDVGNNAHNTILQFVYDNGIFTGIIFLIMQLYAYFKLLNMYWHTHDIKIYFAILIQTSFGVTSLLASLNLPFLYLITFVYYSTFILVMLKGNENYENIRNIKNTL